MKRTKVVLLAIFTVCFSFFICSSIIANAESNVEGWEKRGDGYFYEINPPITDLFEYHEDQSTGEQTNADFYVVNYTGYLDNKTLTPVSRKLFGTKNNSIQSYYTNTMDENPAKEILVIQYDWTINNFKQGSCWNPEYTNVLQRHMDFTFNLDFTDLSDGYFTYVNDSTKITFQVKDNQIIFEQKERMNKLSYGNAANYATQFVNLSDYGLVLKELTGKHKITLLIEDRVLSSPDEITRDGNHGAKATVMIDDVAISYTFEKMGYYAGIFAIANYTNAPLQFYSTKYTLNFDTDGGADTPSVFYDAGEAVTELPTPEKGACIFDGWFTDASCAAGTEFNIGTAITEDITLYAKWAYPAPVNAEGWVFNEVDGFYYEPDPTIQDFISFHETAEENGQAACDFYVIEYTGTMFNNWNNANAMKITGRVPFDHENNTVPSGKAVIAQYDYGDQYCKQGACWNPEYTNLSSRYMDFMFGVDFTNLNSGHFTYIHDNILVTFDLDANQIIIQEKEAANKLQYSYTDSEVFFIDADLSDITGVQYISIIVEDRVKVNTGEITRENNSGARVTVKIGDEIKVSRTIEQCGYYAGIFGIFNYMSADLEILSAKDVIVKERIINFAKESDYNAEIWSEMSEFINSAILSVDDKEISELDAFYAEVTAKLKEYPTLREQQAKEDKLSEVLSVISQTYNQDAYSPENWNKVNSLIEEYETKMSAAVRAAEVASLYKVFLTEADKYFTLKDVAEQRSLIAEIAQYGKDKEYYSANKTEIEEIRAEYLSDIENAPSIWDIRMLSSAAKADIDSFTDVVESVSSGSYPETESGCGGLIAGNIPVLFLAMSACVTIFTTKRKIQ